MKRKGLLLDRDGVINVDRDYVFRIEDFTFMPDLFPLLRTAQERGYRLAIATNQSGVARGRYTEADYEKLTQWMLNELRKEEVVIDRVLASFAYPESFWRKPNPGMILDAVKSLNLDPARSIMIGDHPRDLQAAQAVGIAKRIWLSESTDPVPEGAERVGRLKDVLPILESLEKQ